jgi:hypothetical protein
MNVNSVDEIDKPLIAFRKQAVDDDPISVVISCIGMAGMATQMHSSSLMTGARFMFGQAIHLANMSLKDPIACKSDHTFALIMLLGIFEVCSHAKIFPNLIDSCRDPRTMCRILVKSCPWRPRIARATGD